MQTAQTIFLTQPCYTFENVEGGCFCPPPRSQVKLSKPRKDCVRFQEALFARKVIFVAGVAEIKSKGRGEECISQNLRILRTPNGKQTILFFANSQRKEKKRYVSIPGEPELAFGDWMLLMTSLHSQLHQLDGSKYESRPTHFPHTTSQFRPVSTAESFTSPIS